MNIYLDAITLGSGISGWQVLEGRRGQDTTGSRNCLIDGEI